MSTSRADHPRSRGVYDAVTEVCPGAVGSSPLARGLPQIAQMTTADMRIIPARAGFTRINSLFNTVQPDHPRSRGVYA